MKIRGKYEFKGGKLYKREKESSKMRKFGDAWTINLDERAVQMFLEGIYKELIYVSELHKYAITAPVALKYGLKQTFNGENKLVLYPKYWRIDGKESEFELAERMKDRQLQLI